MSKGILKGKGIGTRMRSSEIIDSWMIDKAVTYTNRPACNLLWHKCPGGGSYIWAKFSDGMWFCPKCKTVAPQEITDFCLLSGIVVQQTTHGFLRTSHVKNSPK